MASHYLNFWFSDVLQLSANRTYPFTTRHSRVIVISPWKWENSILKSHEHESESYNKFKNSLLKITHPNTRCAISLELNFLWASYLSISRWVFVMCYYFKMPLFSNSIEGYLFCWVPFFWVNLIVLLLFL